VVQGIASALVPTRRVLVIGGAVDVLHSASMAVLAGVDEGRRRLALTDSVIASGWAAASLHDARLTHAP
jgi:hypothetical protein